MSRKPRGLHPDEQALWDRVAGTANPLDKARKANKVSNPAKKPPKTAEQTPNTFAPPSTSAGTRKISNRSVRTLMTTIA